MLTHHTQELQRMDQHSKNFKYFILLTFNTQPLNPSAAAVKAILF
jgi:hypothetical protein